VLKALGFIDDPSVLYSDRQPGLSFMLGQHKILASEVVNRWLRPIVQISGVVATLRTLVEVCGEIDRQVESIEHGMAFVAYILRSAVEGMDQSQIPSWLIEGRGYAHLLPWEQERAAHAARLHCYVEHDWVRLGLRALANTLVTADDKQPVAFSFDGSVLTVACAGKSIPMPAIGTPWADRFELAAAQMRNLPRRLARADIEVSIWESRLTIGNRSFSPVIAIDMKEER
jgi:hypothetical protein